MTGIDATLRVNQNNQMMQASIWKLLTLRAQQSLTQYQAEYNFDGVICGLLLLKIIVRTATMDSRENISIIRARLKDIDDHAAGVNGDVEQITKFFADNLERLKALGASLNDKEDVLFKGLKAVRCVKFCSYISRKEEQYTNETL